MITDLVQRRRGRRESYRPAGETINTARYEVARINRPEAKAFVREHHYSGTYPAGRRMFGLFEAADLVGVAVFGTGGNNRTLTNVFPGEAVESVELLRFVLLDRVPGNGETYFLKPCFEALRREGFLGVLSMADPVERRDAAGGVLFGGHIGTIYQAFNALYTGHSTARRKHVFADGTVFDGRALSKARGGERGWRYATAQLVAHGASEPPQGDVERRAWLKYWVGRLTDVLDHPGNYRYAWGLQRTVRRHVSRNFPPANFPYPKVKLPPSVQLAML